MKTLLINSSIRGNESISRSLSQALAEQIGGEVKHRDLTQGLHFISDHSFEAVQIPPSERDLNQQQLAGLADELIDELMGADNIVIGAPVYNFGPPASLKAWADLVARAGTTFRYTENGPEGLLVDKKAYIVAVSGGTPIGSEIDFMSNWLTFFLGFLGVTDVEIISADGLMSQDGSEKISAARAQIKKVA